MVNKSRLLEILESFKDIKVAIVGDMMLDDYIVGDVDRVSPEAPVPVVNVIKERFVLGGAANVASNIASLEAKTYTVGVIGEDSSGERLVNEFVERGIDSSGTIKSQNRPTTVKKRVIAHNQQLLRIDWESKKPITKEEEDKVIESYRSMVEEIDATILSDYDKGVLTKRVATEIIKISKEHGKIVVVDPKPKNATNYIGATSMTPNRKEASECIGEEIECYEALGKKLKKELQLDNLLLTRSEEGMSLFLDETINIPTFAKEVYDVTGAGDTVISVYTLAAAAGASWHEAAKIANTAAGIVVGRMGTSTVTKDEIITFYDDLYHEWN